MGELESELAAVRDGWTSSPERSFHDLLMEAAPVFFVAIGGDGRTLSMNNAMLEALGYTAEEVKDADYLTTFVPEADRPKLAEVFSQMTVEKQQTLSENRVLTKSGEEILVEWHGRPVVGNDGRLQCFFGVGLDITEQRRSQEELQSRRHEAQEYLDLAGVIFLGLDHEGRVSQVNRQGCEVLGGSEADIVGLSWFDHFVPEKQRQQVREVFAALMSGDVENYAGEYENEIVTLGGERRHIEWHNAVEHDQDGNIIGTMSSGIDITDRKHAENVQRLAYEIGSSIHATKSVQELFGRIRQSLGGVMNTENFFIALYNREKDTLSLSYFVDEKDQDDFDSFPAGKTLTGYIIKHDTSLLVDRSELDEWTRTGIVDMVGTPSLIWLGVPLRVSGEVIGALVVQSYTDANEFGKAEQEMLEFVSGQIGFAIEHKRAEDELMSSEAKNRSILDAVPDMMFSIDRGGVFRSYDAPGDALLAMPPETFLNKHV
ncbi:MAG: PAS domain S-box protein, partial [Candidatus Eisenbacteria bacterium]